MRSPACIAWWWPKLRERSTTTSCRMSAQRDSAYASESSGEPSLTRTISKRSTARVRTAAKVSARKRSRYVRERYIVATMLSVGAGIAVASRLTNRHAGLESCRVARAWVSAGGVGSSLASQAPGGGASISEEGIEYAIATAINAVRQVSSGGSPERVRAGRRRSSLRRSLGHRSDLRDHCAAGATRGADRIRRGVGASFVHYNRIPLPWVDSPPDRDRGMRRWAPGARHH